MNQELKKGDRVMLLHMEDSYSGLMPGTWGTVTSEAVIMGVKQYGVNWDNGTKEKPGEIISKLQLLSDIDMWTTEGFKKKLKENKIISKKNFIKETDDLEREWKRNMSIIKNIDVIRFFDFQFFRKYLDTLKESGIVNMFGASPYLYMGRDRIKHEFTYEEIPNEEAFNQLLDMADESQAKMIDGIIKLLDDMGKESDLTNINSKLRRYSDKILNSWINLH